MFVNTRQAHVIQSEVANQSPGECVWGGAWVFRPGKLDRDIVMMRGDYVSRMEGEELGRTETSEECRHP